jgi:chromosomal replication initiation ATPase DnaA
MTNTKRPLHVFLCHASSDKPAVTRLYERLISDGIDAWLDKEKLIPGQDWQIEIPKAVKNSDIVIVCLSSQSVTKEGFVQKELKFSLDVADEKPDGTIFLIPARLEDCKVPERIKKYQWVDLFLDDGYEQLFKALQLRAANLGITIRRKTEASNIQSKNKRIKKNETLNLQKTFKLWGRENEITRIMNVLHDPKGLPFISISGLGGIGKTALARAIASECQRENFFSQIIWETAQYEIVSGNDIVVSTPSFSTLKSLAVNILTKLGFPNMTPLKKGS